jgi:hypothetical protein
MPEIPQLYPVVDGKTEIVIPLSSPEQIFNPYSPVPFNEKELTTATEEYLVETIRDFPGKTRFRVVFRMPPAAAELPESRAIPEAIRSHFRYRMLAADRRYRQVVRYGKKCLVIALCVLALSTFVSRAIYMYFDELLPVVMIADGITIVGWVAMWAPASVLVLELWPIREIRRIYERIISMEIVVAKAS